MNRTPAFHGLRAELRSRWPEWAAVSAFAAVVAFAMPCHEPWTDEAQAWKLKRFRFMYSHIRMRRRSLYIVSVRGNHLVGG
jgi:hypothetical protein